MVPPEMGSSIKIGDAVFCSGVADGSTVTGLQGGQVYLSAVTTAPIPTGTPVTFS